MHGNPYPKMSSEPFTGPSGEVSAAMKADHKDFKKTMTAIDQLKTFYMEKVLPLEKKYWFGSFHTVNTLTDAYFDSLPMVLLLGQYSVGKTSFIRYLLERDHPGLRVGPEPTTDRFVAVMHGKDDRTIPGNAAVIAADKPFRGLEKYGLDFLNKFECCETDCEILKKISLIDTPGVLAGAKQVKNRGYDMSSITEWFADRCDRILVLFDAHKLDISDEMKGVMSALKGHHNKVRIVLNKADTITSKQLMRVYGALMWSLGRVIDSPESLRVYVGTFWERPMQKRQFSEFMAEERLDLLEEIRRLPQHSSLRKVNNLVRRCRYFKVHLAILKHLRSQFSMMTMFKESKQKELMKGLISEFKKIGTDNGIPAKDFPSLTRFRQRMEGHQLWKLPKIDQMKIDFENLEKMLAYDIADIMKNLPTSNNSQEKKAAAASLSSPSSVASTASHTSQRWRGANNNSALSGMASPSSLAATAPTKTANGSSFLQGSSPQNPFGAAPATSSSTNPFGPVQNPWVVNEQMFQKCKGLFSTLKPINGKVAGKNAKEMLMKSGLSMQQLREIWKLSDIDKDGQLDVEEFSLAMYLIDGVRRGKMQSIPSALSPEMVPPSKR